MLRRRPSGRARGGAGTAGGGRSVIAGSSRSDDRPSACRAGLDVPSRCVRELLPMQALPPYLQPTMLQGCCARSRQKRMRDPLTSLPDTVTFEQTTGRAQRGIFTRRAGRMCGATTAVERARDPDSGAKNVLTHAGPRSIHRRSRIQRRRSNSFPDEPRIHRLVNHATNSLRECKAAGGLEIRTLRSPTRRKRTVSCVSRHSALRRRCHQRRLLRIRMSLRGASCWRASRPRRRGGDSDATAV